MAVTNFDLVKANFIQGPTMAAEIPATTGTVFWVSSVTGSNGNDGLGPNSPLATTTAARALCTANKGDVIVWMPNHAETFATAAAFVGSVAGVTYVALGSGTDRATFTFNGVTGASFDMTADDCRILGYPIGIAGLDGLTKPFNITGNNFYGEIEWRDGSSTVEAETVVRLDTADNSTLKLIYKGFTAGNAAVRVVAVDDCDNVNITIDGYGVVSTAWVNLVDVASTNVSVRGRLYTQGITNFSRDVVDTVGGSTWDADIFDASFGGKVSGGSAAALASDDASAISAQLNVPSADAVTNTTIAHVIGNKTDNQQTALNSTSSMMAYTKGLVTMVSGARRVSSVNMASAAMTGTATQFTVSNGPIRVYGLGFLVTTAIPAGANTLKFSFTPTGGGATDLSGATDTASAAATQFFIVDGVKATGLVKTTDPGIGVFANEHMPIVLSTGVIQTIFSAGAPASGAATVYLEWEPLTSNSNVA